MKVDTGNEQDVLKMLQVYDEDAKGIFLDWNHVTAYDYATKKAKVIQFGSQMSVIEILKQVGFVDGKNNMSASAYFITINCGTNGTAEYAVKSINKYQHKLGLPNEHIIKGLD